MQFFIQNLKNTITLRSFGLFKVPLLAFVRPSVLECTSERIEVKIPLNRWTRNHLNSMYFGALAIGADTAVGLLAFNEIKKSGKNIHLIFKDFKADFHQRAEGDVHFICEMGNEIVEMVNEASQSQERVTKPILAYATVPKISDEPVASFTLSLSLKVKG